MSLDLEKEYNNRARVPENPAIIASWASDSAAYREAKPPREIAYGAGERHKFDFFEAGDGPAVMYIHGGYWQALDKSFHSIHARGLNELGVSVAVPSYDLCPNVHVVHIIEQIRAACTVLERETNAQVVASGHSAGGHLAACMLSRHTQVPAAYAISGVFDLMPLLDTSLNDRLGLDASGADAVSPLYFYPPAGKILDAVVGGAESSEFLRQSDAIVRAWGREGVETRYEEIENANHFTVIAPLTDPNSAMCERLKQLTHRARGK